MLVKNCQLSPGWCGSVGWVSTCKAKSCWFSSWLGHVPGLWVRSLVRACVKDNKLMFLSPIDVSLPLIPFPSLLSKVNKHVLGR